MAWQLEKRERPHEPFLIRESESDAQLAIVLWDAYEEQEAETNARLIAAAPELLAAARFAASVLDVVMGNNVWEARQQLQAAIDKAVI